MDPPALPPDSYLMLGQNRLECRQVDGSHSQPAIFIVVVVPTTSALLTRVSHRCEVGFHVLVEKVNVRLEERYILLACAKFR